MVIRNLVTRGFATREQSGEQESDGKQLGDRTLVTSLAGVLWPGRSLVTRSRVPRGTVTWVCLVYA